MVKLACQLTEMQYDLVKHWLKQSFIRICKGSVVTEMSTQVVPDFNSSHKKCMSAQSFDSLQPHGLQPAKAPLSKGFSRQEYWSGLLFPPPGDLPDPGKEPGSPALQADSLPAAPPGKPRSSEAGAEKAGICQGGISTRTVSDFT